ncbi:MAG: MFS transporter [Gammaproteobacteria bacterium]|nr:MFS transporter [Gammaproteobacteria bacterium]
MMAGLRKAHRVGVNIVLGFSTALPVALSGSTLQAWLTRSGVSIEKIGLFSLAAQPYVYKFLWAPLVDRFAAKFPFLDRRRSWMVIMEIFLALALAVMAFFDPHGQLKWMAMTAFIIATCTATHDIAYDAYRTDLLQPEERGLASAIMLTGYRIAIVVSSAVALSIAAYYGWRTAYLIMALMMLLGIVVTFLSPRIPTISNRPVNLKAFIVEPIRDFCSRKSIIMILLVVLFYKLGDAFTVSLTTPFILRGLHFSLQDLAWVAKTGGLFATLIGGFIGGYIMLRARFYTALMGFAILQTLSNLSYLMLAIVGKNYFMLFSAVIVEHVCSGMGTVAFLAMLMALCDHRYSATQFAFLSAVATLGRVYIGPVAGILVTHVGWIVFYIWAFVAGFPSIIALWLLNRHIDINDLASQQQQAP